MNKIPDRFPATLSDCLTDFLSPFTELTLRLEMEFSDRLDAARLEKAVELTLDAEPVLGCRFVDNSRKPYFERLGTDRRLAFQLVNSASEYEKFKFTPIDYRTGPLINVCLWHSSSGDRLLMKVAHHVADASGIKDTAAILSGIYRKLSEDTSYQLSPNIKEWRSLRQVTRHVPWHAYPRIFMNFLERFRLLISPYRVHTLSVADGPREPLTYVIRLIPVSRVSALAEYGRLHNATLNDVFLTASIRSFLSMADRDKRSHFSLMSTIDMRRYIPSGHAGAVANLSAGMIHWPGLGAEPGYNFDNTLDQVAKITRYGKTHWIGCDQLFLPITWLSMIMPHTWGMKRYGDLVRLSLRQHGFDHGLTNTGPIDPGSVIFGTQPSIAHILPPQAYPPLPFTFSLSGYNGTLTLASGAYPTQKETIEKFFDAVLKELPV